MNGQVINPIDGQGGPQDEAKALEKALENKSHYHGIEFDKLRFFNPQIRNNDLLPEEVEVLVAHLLENFTGPRPIHHPLCEISRERFKRYDGIKGGFKDVQSFAHPMHMQQQAGNPRDGRAYSNSNSNSNSGAASPLATDAQATS